MKRTVEIKSDQDGCVVWLSIPYEAIVFDRYEGKQRIKDRIEDTVADLAECMDHFVDTEQLIFDDDDRCAIQKKIRSGKSVV